MRHALTATLTITVGLLVPTAVLAQSPSPPTAPSPSAGSTVTTGAVVTCPVPAAALPGNAGASPGAAASIAGSAPPASPTAGSTWDGTWAPMPDAPISARTGAATDYADPGHAIYIWGGRGVDGSLLDDGAVFHVKEQQWETLPATDLVPRQSFGFDSDGRGITIWGGVDASGTPLADGARLILAKDDRSMSWQALPTAPLTPGPASLSGDNNITFAVTPGAHADDPPLFAVLDKDAGKLAWDDPSSPNRRLHGKMPAPQVPAGVAYEIAAADGQESAVLVSYQADGTATASWFTKPWPGTWSKPVTIPLPGTAGCPATSPEQLAWVRTGSDGNVAAYLARSSGKGELRTTTAAPAGTPTGGMIVWSPSRLIVADALLAYDTSSKAWTQLPALPDGPRTGVSAAWSDGSLYLWGGRGSDDQASDTGWVFTPAPSSGVYALVSAPAGDCGGQGDPSSAVFRAEEGDADKVWMKLDGRRIAAIWPEGYTVRFREGGAVIMAPDGTVVAREGQRLSATSLDGCLTGDRILLR